MRNAIVLGAGFGLGLFLLIRILVPTRLPLAAALARVDAATATVPPRTAAWSPGQTTGRIADRLRAAEWLLGERYADALLRRGLLGKDLRADLALLGRDERAYAARKLLQALAVLLLAPIVLVPLTTLSGLPWLAGGWLSVLAAAGAFVLPDAKTGRQAKSQRRDVAAAIAAYLDLVAMRAASGSGISEALRDAARIGTGPAFVMVREALDDARMSGSSPGSALERLGEEIDVVELSQLASQLHLIDSSGAQAEASLRAKADALRARQLTDAHGSANERSESMLIGQVLLGLGFLIFLGYPAVAQVLTL